MLDVLLHSVFNNETFSCDQLLQTVNANFAHISMVINCGSYYTLNRLFFFGHVFVLVIHFMIMQSIFTVFIM